MKHLILSRKGFDSSLQCGRVPSPIFEDGTMTSLPIPEVGSPRKFSGIRSGSRNLGTLVSQLSDVHADDGAHLDPDLDPNAVERSEGWRACFGQAAAAQGTLKSAGVEPGDIFLFFGWFRQVEEIGSKLRYVRGAEHQHVIFGWMQIGEIIDLNAGEPRPWAFDHPHWTNQERQNNTLYVASDTLSIGKKGTNLPAAGVFRRYHKTLRLTAPTAAGRSIWSLPKWFYPSKGRSPLGYHQNLDRWSKAGGDRCELRTVGRGQEFVLDVEDYPEAHEWAASLIAGNANP